MCGPIQQTSEMAQTVASWQEREAGAIVGGGNFSLSENVLFVRNFFSKNTELGPGIHPFWGNLYRDKIKILFTYKITNSQTQ